MDEKRRICLCLCRGDWHPILLESAATTVLVRRRGGWFEFQMDALTNSPVLLFHYPTIAQSGFEYLKRSVKLNLDHSRISAHWAAPDSSLARRGV